MEICDAVNKHLVFQVSGRVLSQANVKILITIVD